MKKTTKPRAKKVKVEGYTATVKVLGVLHKAKGETISEAIAGLQPKNCKGKAILTVSRGDVSKDKILMPMMAFRLFSSHGIGREVALKNASNLFLGI